MSLDFFRGFTMFLLIAESTDIYDFLVAPELNGTLISAIGTQFHHHPWNGLRFWDLIQPFFMFIVGVAMPFSIGRRWEQGDSWATTFRHALQRSFLLLLFGWGLYCIGPGKLTFELWNVLAQLSFTYLVAFLMMRKSSATQIVFTSGLLVITELAYRLWSVPGFNEAFVPDRNFGSYVASADGNPSRGHWVRQRRAHYTRTHVGRAGWTAPQERAAPVAEDQDHGDCGFDRIDRRLCAQSRHPHHQAHLHQLLRDCQRRLVPAGVGFFLLVD
jgi:hypothetical protein